MGKKNLSSIPSVSSVKQWLPHLTPFFVSGWFFIHFFVDELTNHSILAAFFKCAPIIALIHFVLSQGGIDKRSKRFLSYKKSVALGLILGCIGDACLVFQNTLFIHGMIAFALGHVFFIYAAGFKPLRLGLGIGLYIISGIFLYCIREYAPDPFVRDAMPIYSLFLVTMCWRSLARANSTFPRRAGALGGLLFIISDFILVLQLKEKSSYGDLAVITTYYLSQLGTSLSVLDPSADL